MIVLGVTATDLPTLAAPLSTYPVASSDVALTVARSFRTGDVEEALRDGAGALLESMVLFDVYRGDQIGADEQSLAFRLTFRAADHTLTTAEVNQARDRAVDEANRRTGAVLRGG